MRRSVVLLVSPLLLLLPAVIVFASTSVSFQNNTIILPGLLASSFTATPNAVSVGQPVSLSCSAKGGTSPYAYSWTLGDGNTGTGPDPSHMYTIQGLMRIVCSVTDGSGTLASSVGYLTVS